jgi:NCS2 family nucleobase:cation symporter-2
LFSSLGTLAAGYVAGSLLGFITPEMWARVQAAAWLDVPHLTILGLGQAGWGHPGLAFSPALVPAFLAFGIGATMKAAGDAAISEKLANADWKRADLKREGPAVLNVGLGSVLSALIGGFPINASSSNIGLSAATGAASRYIGFACGGLLIALTFSPKLMAFLTVAPAPVAGAMFLLVVSYNLIAGMQIIMSRAMEARHTYIIGLSLLIGLSADVMPEAYSNLPDWLRPFFASSMSISTTMVVLLNVLFRIGAGRKKTIRLQPGVETIRRLVDFLENFGADAGARRDVLSKAVSALVEFFESVTQNELTEGPVDVTASFDEFHLNFTIRYHGTPVEIPASRPMISLESTPEDLVRLSGYMLGRLADSVETWSADGVVEIHIKFEH